MTYVHFGRSSWRTVSQRRKWAVKVRTCRPISRLSSEPDVTAARPSCRRFFSSNVKPNMLAQLWRLILFMGDQNLFFKGQLTPLSLLIQENVEWSTEIKARYVDWSKTVLCLQCGHARAPSVFRNSSESPWTPSPAALKDCPHRVGFPLISFRCSM